MEYTHGGLDVKLAWVWDRENCQRLGSIVEGLMSSDWKKREDAWTGYYNMKRMFMIEAWDKYISKLETFRMENGVRTISEMLKEVSDKLVKRAEPEKEGNMYSGVAKALRMLADELEKVGGVGAVEDELNTLGETLPEIKAQRKKKAVVVEPIVEEAPALPVTESPKEPEPPVVEDVAPEPEPTDYLKECKVLIGKMVENKKYTEAAAILATFNAKKISEVAVTALPKLYEALKEA